MADFVVVFNSSTLEVFGVWARTTSDNISTFVADEKLTVDGVDVIEGGADFGASIAAAVLTDPTDSDVLAPPGVFEVDNATPTDMTERTDDHDTGGSRDGDYDFAV